MSPKRNRVNGGRKSFATRGPRHTRNRFRPLVAEGLEDRLLLTGPDLAIGNNTISSSYNVGDTITYTEDIGNVEGADPILLGTPVTATDLVAQGLSNLSVSSSLPGSWSFTLTSTTSPALITATYTGAYPIPAGSLLPAFFVSGTANGSVLGLVANVATVSVEGDENLANNSATNDVEIMNVPAASTLAVAPAAGVYGGTTDIQALLTSGGEGVAGEQVDFHLGALDLGTVTTDSNGLAEISGAPLGTLDVGTYIGDVTASFAGDESFDPSSGSNDLTVTPAPLTIVANNQSKVYGQANPTLTGTVSGILNGDDVTASYATTATQFSDVQAGGYPITLAGLTGAKAEDYSTTVEGASFTTGTLTVTPAPLTIVADNLTKVYGQANPTLTGTVSGLLNGDDLTINLATNASPFSNVQAGGDPITLASLTGTKAIDYSTTVEGGSFTPGTLTVTPAPLTVVTNNQTRLYGQANPTLTGTVTGILNGDNVTIVYSTVATPSSDVWASGYLIGPTSITGPKAADYETYVPGGPVTAGILRVTPAPLTVVANSSSRVYGQANPTLTGTVSGVLNGDNVTAQFATTATASSHVVSGGYPITFTGLSGTKSEDYTASTSTPGTLTVTPAPLTVKANNTSKVYGQVNPAFTASYQGFVLGQNSGALSGTLKFTTPATVSSPVGGYPITPGGLTSSDYAISFNAGTLSVIPAALTVSANNAVMAYGNAVPTLTVHYSGFVNGDTPASLSKPVKVSTSATASSPFGTYPISVSGAASGNYSIRYVPGVLTVEPSPGPAAFVNTLYQLILGRPPEPSGLASWLTQLSRGESQSLVAMQIYNSSEAQQLRAHNLVRPITEASAYARALQAEAEAEA